MHRFRCYDHIALNAKCECRLYLQKIASFWGTCPLHTPCGALPLDSAGGLQSAMPDEPPSPIPDPPLRRVINITFFVAYAVNSPHRSGRDFELDIEPSKTGNSL